MIAGRTLTGRTLGDSETQSLIPTLVDLLSSGQLPVDKLIRHYRFDDINPATADGVSGATIKPVLRF